MKVNGKEDLETDLGLKNGLTEHCSKETGKWEKFMEQANSNIQMETSMRENSSIQKLMGTGLISMLMELYIKVNGKTMFKKEQERKSGLTPQCTKAAISVERNTEQVFTSGQTALNTQEIGKKITSQDLEFTNGMMAGLIMENGT